MEKSPAACAMDWSIHLEKSLRSKTPGKSIEALEEIGKQLNWWNSESELSSAEYRMFGLIPGEDKLFLNSIFLRLADAFRLGNKHFKIAVVKLFLRIKKKRRKRDGEGILSKGKLENHLELLSRVKEVFDKGDAEERALTLLLFGAWASFSKDCADIRYTVLSSLVTGDIREVKAAMFAAGCLSELSDDFANVYLEILTTMVLSLEISSDVKLAGARALAKLWCPISVADKAYKIYALSCVDLDRQVYVASLEDTSCRQVDASNSYSEVSELFLKLLSAAKNVLKSSILSTRVLAVNVLADISGKVLGRVDMVSGEAGRTLASQVISFVLDHILDLVKPKTDVHQADFDVEVKYKLMKMLEAVKDTEISDPSNLMLYFSKVIVTCLQRPEETDVGTSQVLNALKLRSENVCNCSYFGSHVSMAYFLLLHLLCTFICMRHATEESISLSNQSDKFSLDCAKKIILGRNNYWYLYKTGEKAACQGAWSTCAFIFEELITAVESDSCLCWLKSLARFSAAEKQIQPFRLTDIENLSRASNTLLSTKRILIESDTGNKFSFQTRFLTLRANTLKTVVDMIKLINTRHPLVDSSMEVSFRMMKLAREFDLLLTSFIGMDRQSVTSVSALALSCSLMAFTAGFAFLAQNERISKFGKAEEPFFALLIEDLFGRLTDIDCKTRKNLLSLLKPFRSCKGCFSGRLQNRITYTSYEAVVLHKLTEYSVGEIFCLRNEAKNCAQQDDGDAISRILTNGSQLLSNIISKLMSIPFRTPRHFFRVRPAVSSEIIAMNEDGQMIDGSSILSGSHLSLNLSFQLKSMSVGGPPGPLNKAYCILNCEGQAESSRQDQDIGDLLDLNEKLLRYVAGSAQTHHGLHCAGPNDHLMVNEYLCFELNGRRQGFSTCLLDVSCFPVGSYRIKWLSGCVDSVGSYWSLLPVNSGPLFTILDRM
ncbi:integrator complex subunit 7 [Phtheirospermum japonicum]|uniref:Integrator complex subunit 7 n=1 Tax=Phtheirospermum japonicum TaxID=374723 RepID=A0A830C971_9LAMI|nr:integrator complex subunit 7 [Phtheirospermum japonicum]